MTIGSPVASAVSGPGTAETNAMRLPSGDHAIVLPAAGQRRVRAGHFREQPRAGAVRLRDDEAGLVADAAAIRDPLAVGRPLADSPDGSLSAPKRTLLPSASVITQN